MVLKLGTSSTLTVARWIPMVELATINKALPGDSPDSQKKNWCFKHFSLFWIKFRLPDVQIGRVLFVPTFVFLLNKNRYKNKCGGDLSKSPISNSFVISPPTCCTSLTVQHAEDQDRWNPEEDGRTSGSTKPLPIPSVPSSSSSNDGLHNPTLKLLPNFLSLMIFFVDH